MADNPRDRLQLAGIYQNLAATAVSSIFGPIALYIIQRGWPLIATGNPPEWLQPTLANSFGAARAFGVLGAISWVRFRHKTAKATGDRIAIYVALLDGDDAYSTLRRSVIDTLRQELGRKAVEVIPAGILLRLNEAVSDDLAALGAQKEAQKLLRSKGGHVLVWGRIHKHGGRTIIELRFASGTYGSEGNRFGITEKLLLEPDFLEKVGGALAGVVIVAAVPAIFQPGKFFPQTLVTVADRMRCLIDNLPSGFCEEDLALIYFAYGISQLTIGKQSGDDQRLGAAAQAFRGALEGWTRERNPSDWAATQVNLGIALTELGTREGDVSRLNEAVGAFNDALCELTPETPLLGWAIAKSNLGAAFLRLGELGVEEALTDAIASFREALGELTRERAPHQWAMAQMNLGTALHLFSKIELGGPHLEGEIDALQEALKEFSPNSTPLLWGATLNNLGNSLQTLGIDESSSVRLKESIAVFRKALKVRKRHRTPHLWAKTQMNLGLSFAALGNLDRDTGPLNRAVMAYRQALKEFTRVGAPFMWAQVQQNLTLTYLTLFKTTSQATYLDVALAAIDGALEEFRKRQGTECTEKAEYLRELILADKENP